MALAVPQWLHTHPITNTKNKLARWCTGVHRRHPLVFSATFEYLPSSHYLASLPGPSQSPYQYPYHSPCPPRTNGPKQNSSHPIAHLPLINASTSMSATTLQGWDPERYRLLSANHRYFHVGRLDRRRGIPCPTLCLPLRSFKKHFRIQARLLIVPPVKLSTY